MQRIFKWSTTYVLFNSFKYYVFYDLETTGMNPAFDQILQFAAVKTDLDLNEIERIVKSYFYSVNRHGFKMHKYNAQGFYNLKFNKRWNTLIYKFTHTYQLEFLGEKIK